MLLVPRRARVPREAQSTRAGGPKRMTRMRRAARFSQSARHEGGVKRAVLISHGLTRFQFLSAARELFHRVEQLADTLRAETQRDQTCLPFQHLDRLSGTLARFD